MERRFAFSLQKPWSNLTRKRYRRRPRGRPGSRFSHRHTRNALCRQRPSGHSPGFGLTVTLPRLVGMQRATLFYTGARVPGEQALAWGLADALAGAETLRSDAALAEDIAKSAPLAVVSVHATLRRAWLTRLRGQRGRVAGAAVAPGNGRRGGHSVRG